MQHGITRCNTVQPVATQYNPLPHVVRSAVCNCTGLPVRGFPLMRTGSLLPRRRRLLKPVALCTNSRTKARHRRLRRRSRNELKTALPSERRFQFQYARSWRRCGQARSGRPAMRTYRPQTAVTGVCACRTHAFGASAVVSVIRQRVDTSFVSGNERRIVR